MKLENFPIKIRNIPGRLDPSMVECCCHQLAIGHANMLAHQRCKQMSGVVVLQKGLLMQDWVSRLRP